MNKKNTIKKLVGDKKGFTLIELLVVIAIIGILAAVLMVNLASTRNKARDSAIKLEMGQIRTAMESFYTAGNTYVGGGASADVVALRAGIVANGGTAAAPFESASTWCSEYTLNTGGGSWCVDSTGYAGPIADCEDTNYNCATP